MAIIIEFSGGLGNQLFQLSKAVSLAEDSGRPIWADLRNYRRGRMHTSRDTDRAFALNGLPLIKRYINGLPSPLLRLRGIGRLERWCLHNLGSPRVTDDTKSLLSDKSNTTKRGVRVSGYFQGLEHLPSGSSGEKYKSGIRQFLKQRGSATPDNGTPSVVAHIRLGDYTNHPEFFTREMLEYYTRATRIALASLRTRDVTVVSNDPAAAKNLLKGIDADVRLAPADQTEDGWDHLKLMTQARALVIANSTYSWWGAYLNNTAKVWAPSFWSSNHPEPSSFLYPSHWSCLQA